MVCTVRIYRIVCLHSSCRARCGGHSLKSTRHRACSANKTELLILSIAGKYRQVVARLPAVAVRSCCTYSIERTLNNCVINRNLAISCHNLDCCTSLAKSRIRSYCKLNTICTHRVCCRSNTNPRLHRVRNRDSPINIGHKVEVYISTLSTNALQSTIGNNKTCLLKADALHNHLLAIRYEDDNLAIFVNDRACLNLNLTALTRSIVCHYFGPDI